MKALQPFDELDIEGLDRLASRLALVLQAGDCVALSGELGAGKTTLARALVQHIWGADAEEVISPTFALTETYATPRMDIAHFDCFRLQSPSELEEVGLEAALDEALVLIEWPEQIADRLPADRLEIKLSDGSTDTARAIELEGHGDWETRLQRFVAMTGFLEKAGWGQVQSSYLQGDASPRRYARLADGDRSALLMDAPRQPDGPPVRDGKPYSALVHLAEDARSVVAVADALQAAGLSAPDIYAYDLEHGFLLVEDLGDRVYGHEIAEGRDPAELYGAAVEVLLALRQSPPGAVLDLPDGGGVDLPIYDATAFAIEAELLLDWFWPALRSEAAPAIMRAEFLELWGAQITFLAAQRRGWVLRDFHSPNLLWLPDREGIARVGVIDFQDAMRGPHAYDLVSLLQDARRDVAAELEADLLETYCRKCEIADPSFERRRFQAAYAIAGAQRCTKILGIFARLAARDGKTGYLAHIPRVSAYLERNLAHDALKPLKDWYDQHLPQTERAGLAGV